MGCACDNRPEHLMETTYADPGFELDHWREPYSGYQNWMHVVFDDRASLLSALTILEDF